MRTLLLVLSLICAWCTAKAQDTPSGSTPGFYAQVSRKEVLLGNSITVSYHLENSQGGKFTPPDWQGTGFRLQGSNQSSSISMVNGVTNASVTYQYTVAPRDTGTLIIPKASIREGDRDRFTEPISIKVLPNPDGSVDTPDPAPAMPPRQEPKKKIKTTRI